MPTICSAQVVHDAAMLNFAKGPIKIKGKGGLVVAVHAVSLIMLRCTVKYRASATVDVWIVQGISDRGPFGTAPKSKMATKNVHPPNKKQCDTLERK